MWLLLLLLLGYFRSWRVLFARWLYGAVWKLDFHGNGVSGVYLGCTLEVCRRGGMRVSRDQRQSIKAHTYHLSRVVLSKLASTKLTNIIQPRVSILSAYLFCYKSHARMQATARHGSCCTCKQGGFKTKGTASTEEDYRTPSRPDGSDALAFRIAASSSSRWVYRLSMMSKRLRV